MGTIARPVLINRPARGGVQFRVLWAHDLLRNSFNTAFLANLVWTRKQPDTNTHMLPPPHSAGPLDLPWMHVNSLGVSRLQELCSVLRQTSRNVHFSSTPQGKHQAPRFQFSPTEKRMVSRSVGQSIGEPVRQSVGESVIQPFSHSGIPSFSHSVSQSVS